jgi:hypothetical protein
MVDQIARERHFLSQFRNKADRCPTGPIPGGWKTGVCEPGDKSPLLLVR